MKRGKRLFSLILAAVLAFGALSGCESNEKKKEKLQGTWTVDKVGSEKDRLALLKNNDFYEEEIALAANVSLSYTKLVTFSGSNYYFHFDKAGTKAGLRAFFQSVMDAMYEGRVELNGVYDMDFGSMTKESFQQFYADIYNAGSYRAFIESLVENAIDYDTYIKAGTYSVKGDYLYCTTMGETETVGLKLRGDTLTLTYVDDIEVYKRE